MSMTPEKQAEVHPALDYDCPFCGAHAGQQCHALRGRRGEVSPHMRRVRRWSMANDMDKGREAAPTRARALCCECGALRTVSSNFSFPRSDVDRVVEAAFDDPRGWRCTGTLKCDHCGRPTRHALLRDDLRRDYAEEVQRFILGGDELTGTYQPDLNRLRKWYMPQFPRNPYLKHRWSADAEAEARRRRLSHLIALCGASAPLPSNAVYVSYDDCDGFVPEEVRDQEYEDAETGLWWVDMDCVDCLRVANQKRLEWRREDLALRLSKLALEAESLDAATVDQLLAATEFVASSE